MSNFMRSARFITFTALMLGSAACSKTSRDSGKEPEGVTPTEPGPGVKDKDKVNASGQAKDADLIQGTWEFERSEFQGRKKPGRGEAVMIFEGDKMIVKEVERERTEAGTFRLDQTMTPKTIEIGVSVRDSKVVLPGIYELNGDQLRICYVRDPDGKRPTTFETQPGTELQLWVLKRNKNAGEYKEPDGTGYATAIIGKWTPFSHGETAFGPFSFDTEFTKDGSMLQLDPEKKEWAESFKYRFDKAELVLTSTQYKKADGGPIERRVKIARITNDELVATSPSGILRRVK